MTNDSNMSNYTKPNMRNLSKKKRFFPYLSVRPLCLGVAACARCRCLQVWCHHAFSRQRLGGEHYPGTHHTSQPTPTPPLLRAFRLSLLTHRQCNRACANPLTPTVRLLAAEWVLVAGLAGTGKGLAAEEALGRR
jgi:hypothetical protein